MDFELLSQSVSLAMAPISLLSVLIGALWGALIGALPGLGSAIAITMVLPFTYAMPPVAAIALVMSIYCSSVYGGSISAILLNTPGTPQSAATCFDGFPMAKQGRAGEALGWVTIASVIGGLFSCIVLILTGPQLASLAQNFGPLETSALILMALTCIAGVSRGSMAPGLLAGCIGLFLGCIGSDPMSGDMRFTFGFFQLEGGIDLIAVVVGIFALTEVLARAWEVGTDGTLIKYDGIRFAPWHAWKARLGTLIKSCLIGTGVGILPGTGAATACFISYAEAKRSAPQKADFGKGEPAGIIASEASNNAVTGGALVPTLALGIPGDSVTAIMMVTLVMHGMTPGVRLMKDNPDTVMATFIMLFIANLLILPVGILVSRLFAQVLRLPEALLMGGVVILCTLGTYANRSSAFDLVVTLLAGLLGCAMRRFGMPIAPLVIGFVLSNQLEISLRQSQLVTNGDITQLVHYPVAIGLLLLTATILVFPFIRSLKERRTRSGSAQ